MKLAIIGSRTCPPIDIEAYLKYIPDTIVSGGARGADTYAREFAQKHNLKLIEFLPEYDKYGRTAPLVKNMLIVEECDCVLACVFRRYLFTRLLIFSIGSKKRTMLLQFWLI